MRDREESPYDDDDYGTRRRDKSYDDYSRSSRYRSRSRSRSGRRRSRTRSGERRYSRSYRSRSRSPTSSRGRDKYNDNPEPSRCLGIFGMSLYTTERELERVLSKYGPLEKINVVKDAKTDRSRGFAFVYYESLEDAKVAKEACNGIELDGRKIRCDYSITKRAHTPTPGIYMGRPTFTEKRPRRRSPGYRRSPSYDRDYYGRRSRSRSYSPRRY